MTYEETREVWIAIAGTMTYDQVAEHMGISKRLAYGWGRRTGVSALQARNLKKFEPKRGIPDDFPALWLTLSKTQAKHRWAVSQRTIEDWSAEMVRRTGRTKAQAITDLRLADYRENGHLLTRNRAANKYGVKWSRIREWEITYGVTHVGAKPIKYKPTVAKDRSADTWFSSLSYPGMTRDLWARALGKWCPAWDEETADA